MFSEKVRRVLAYKHLDWTDIEVPPLPPKEHLIPLTGGYRRMPVLQIGADIYCDSALIIQKLEDLAPTPSVFPHGSSGVASMIADWADHRVALWAIVAVFPEYLQRASPAFIADRAALIPDVAPGRVEHLAPHASEQFRQFVTLLDQALASHAYLAGDLFSIADAASYHVLNFARNSTSVFAPAAASSRILDWMQRIAAFPAANVVSKPPQYPLDVAKAATPQDVGDFTATGSPFALGDVVAVAANDYAKEPISGELVKLTATEIAVRRSSERVGDVAIHFPRLGYDVVATERPHGA